MNVVRCRSRCRSRQELRTTAIGGKTPRNTLEPPRTRRAAALSVMMTTREISSKQIMTWKILICQNLNFWEPGTSNVPSEDPYTPVWAAHHDHLYCDRNAVVGIPLTESSSLPQQNAHYMYRVTSRPRYKIQRTLPSSIIGHKKKKKRGEKRTNPLLSHHQIGVFPLLRFHKFLFIYFLFFFI